MFYDGRVKMEQGAVVLRLAPTWFRSVVTTMIPEMFIWQSVSIVLSCMAAITHMFISLFFGITI